MIKKLVLKEKITDIINKHSLLCLYLLMFSGLVFGVVVDSGVKYIHYLCIYVVSFLLIYFSLYSKITNKLAPILNITIGKKFKYLDYIFVSATILFAIGHLISLKQVPIIDAFLSDNSDVICNIRHNITENKYFLWNYGMSLATKALFPFFVFYLYVKKQKPLFFIFISVGLFYSISLIAKSPVVALFVPTLCYTLFKKKYKHFIALLLILVFSIAFIIYVTNPSLRGLQDKATQYENTLDGEKDNSNITNPIVLGVIGIFNRVVLTPGKVVSTWFSIIPEKRPFLYGTGYRFIAPLKNEEFVDYTKILYNDVYPENTKRGIYGTFNAASFMQEYSNFGIYGLVLSGIILGILFVFLQTIFAKNLMIAVSVNIYPVLMLSSGGLSTLLLSGGWGLLVLLSFIFKKTLFNNIDK